MTRRKRRPASESTIQAALEATIAADAAHCAAVVTFDAATMAALRVAAEAFDGMTVEVWIQSAVIYTLDQLDLPGHRGEEYARRARKARR